SMAKLTKLTTSGHAAAEVSEPRGIGMEEDALDLAFGYGQQDGGERTVVPIEDQGRLPVELPRRDVELRAARRRGHEGGHARRALQRPAQVADALEHATLRSAVRDQDRVRGQQFRERGHVAG